MIANWVFPRQAPPRRARRPSRRSSPASFRIWARWEALEDRSLPSAAIPVYQTFNLPGGNLPPGGNLAHVQKAPVLPVRAMERTVVNGALPKNDPGDVVRVALQAGEPLTLSVSAPSASASPITIELADPSGRVVAVNSGVKVNPDTGGPFAGSALSYKATAAGLYTIALLNAHPSTAPAAPSARPYTLFVRPIGLASATTGTASGLTTQGVGGGLTAQGGGGLVNFQGGGVYAMLQAGRLNIIGPTGYGFDFRGNWTSIAIPAGGGQTQYAFVATAGIQLDTAFGLLPMPLPPSGYMLITTTPNGFANATFGEIATTKIATGLQWLDDLATKFFTPEFGMTAYFDNGSLGFQITQGQRLGIALGSTINASVDPNAPVDAAIPYIYFNSSSGFGGTFGTVTVGVVQSNISAIIDPADPSFYVGAVLPALPVFASAGFGLSRNGLIPMKLAQTPSHYGGGNTFSGNVYAQLEVNIPIPVPGLSINVNGALDLNINANGDNGLANFLQNHPDQFAQALVTNSLPALLVSNPALLSELAVAVNGKLGLTVSPESNLAYLTITLAQGTYIDTGTMNPEFDFRGLATTNFATGTFLANYTSFLSPNQTFILDGYAVPAQGDFGASYTAQYAAFGVTASLTTSFTATGINTASPFYSATINGMLSVPGGSTVNATGTIDSTGKWSVTGTGSVVFAGFTLANGRVTVVPQGVTLQGAVNLGSIGTANFTSGLTTDGNFTLTATAMTNFGINGLPQVSAALALKNSGLTAATTVEFLGQQASLTGAIQPNLTYSLTGSVNAGFSVLGITPTATAAVTLANTGGATSLSGSFDLNFTVSTALANVSLDLATTVYLAFAGFNVPTYSGMATVTGTVGIFSVSTSVAVMNNALAFSIPLLGTITIPLPF
jgi:hypothetical protein